MSWHPTELPSDIVRSRHRDIGHRFNEHVCPSVLGVLFVGFLAARAVYRPAEVLAMPGPEPGTIRMLGLRLNRPRSPAQDERYTTKLQ